jgi:hypothetical protein
MTDEGRSSKVNSNEMGLSNGGESMNVYFPQHHHNHDGHHKVSGILPPAGGNNPEAVADIQRGQWNPSADTVGSVPTQFFLAP